MIVEDLALAAFLGVLQLFGIIEQAGVEVILTQGHRIVGVLVGLAEEASAESEAGPGGIVLRDLGMQWIQHRNAGAQAAHQFAGEAALEPVLLGVESVQFPTEVGGVGNKGEFRASEYPFIVHKRTIAVLWAESGYGS